MEAPSQAQRSPATERGENRAIMVRSRPARSRFREGDHIGESNGLVETAELEARQRGGITARLGDRGREKTSNLPLFDTEMRLLF